MFRTSYFKKFLLSGGTYAATAITSGEGQDGTGTGTGSGSGTGTGGDQGKKGQGETGGTCDPCTGKLMRRTELPLYSETHPEKGDPCEEQESGLEKGISAVRKELWVWSDKYQDYKEKVKDVVITGKEHTAVLVDQLRKDELPVPRAGAVAISGLAGVVLGLRGGWFRRIIYGSTCAGLMAAVCYPNEVADLSEDTIETAKKYILITYNFIYGVKPDSLNLPSPSQLLGGPVEAPVKGKGDVKTSVPAVSEKEAPEASVRIIQPHECPAEPDGPGIPDAPECPVADIMPHECPSKPDGPGGDVMPHECPSEPDGPGGDVMPHECPSKPDGPGGDVMPHECPSKPDGPGGDVMPHECPSKPDGPGLEPIPETMPEPILEPVPEDPNCTCPLAPDHEKTEQYPPFKCSFRSHFDRFSEDSADVKKTSRPNDQSNPADKDLYSSKR